MTKIEQLREAFTEVSWPDLDRDELRALLDLVEKQHEALELAHLRLDGESHLVAKALTAFEEWNRP